MYFSLTDCSMTSDILLASVLKERPVVNARAQYQVQFMVDVSKVGLLLLPTCYSITDDSFCVTLSVSLHDESIFTNHSPLT